MNSVFILIPISIGILAIAVIAFLWAVRSGQYDDTVSPGVRMLFDEKKEKKSEKKSQN